MQPNNFVTFFFYFVLQGYLGDCDQAFERLPDKELKIKPSPIRPYVLFRAKSQLLRRRSSVKVVRDGHPYPCGSPLSEGQGRPLNT